MRKLILVSAAIALSFAVIAALLAATHDGEVLVPPPDMTAETFIKQLQTGRWDRALPLLAESAREKTSGKDLESFTSTFEQLRGRIEDVHGEEGGIEGEEATAHTLIKTPNEETQLTFRLVREHHEWKISELPELNP